MAKVKSLQSLEEAKAKKAAEDLRFKFAKTDEQKKFLKENPNVKTAAEMEKKIKDMKSVGASRMGPFMAKGGRVGLKGGGICKKGMNRKAIGKNS
tara:strand:+ start:202 stop:486 length:285 start_codon:yes stop_codon:yes gene_type:complete